jgi:hypothetical protein
MAGVGDWLHGVLGTKQSVEPVETPGSLIPHPPMRPKSLVSFARVTTTSRSPCSGSFDNGPGICFFPVQHSYGAWPRPCRREG